MSDVRREARADRWAAISVLALIGALMAVFLGWGGLVVWLLVMGAFGGFLLAFEGLRRAYLWLMKEGQ